VVDIVTGVLYRYVVASWELAGAVYIMAAHHVFDDIRSRISTPIVPFDERGNLMDSKQVQVLTDTKRLELMSNSASTSKAHTSAAAQATRHFRDYFANHHNLHVKSTRANIGTALSKVLHKHQDRLMRERSKDRRTKKLVVFVLTDGLWGHNNASRPIRILSGR
jgi:hypothetical protein